MTMDRYIRLKIQISKILNENMFLLASIKEIYLLVLSMSLNIYNYTIN